MPFNNDSENEFKITIEINQRVEHIIYGWFLISIMNTKLQESGLKSLLTLAPITYYSVKL